MLPPSSLCDRYDTISTKVYEDPQSTDEMVNLLQFLTTVSTASVVYREGMLVSVSTNPLCIVT